VATKFDIEALLTQMQSFMQAKLPAKLTALDAEKNDGITLAAVDSGAYTLQIPSYAMTNFDPFVLYGIDDIEPNGGIGPGTREPYKLYVVLGLTDSGNDPDVIKRLLRYQRALKEIFQADWASVAGSVKFKVSGLVPVPLSLLEENKPVRNTKIVGINLDVTLDS